jgi:hypothetical protein
MTTLSMQIMGGLSAIAAAVIFFFDKRQREHNKVACSAAWLLFCLYGSLAIAAWFRLPVLSIWLLLALLAMNVINLILVRGNVSKILPEHIQSKPCLDITEPVKPNTTNTQRRKHKHRHLHQGKHNAANSQ